MEASEVSCSHSLLSRGMSRIVIKCPGNPKFLCVQYTLSPYSYPGPCTTLVLGIPMANLDSKCCQVPRHKATTPALNLAKYLYVYICQYHTSGMQRGLFHCHAPLHSKPYCMLLSQPIYAHVPYCMLIYQQTWQLTRICTGRRL